LKCAFLRLGQISGKISNLKSTELTTKTNKEKELEVMKEKYDKYLPLFLKRFNFPPTTTLARLFGGIADDDGIPGEEIRNMFDIFIKDQEEAKENEAVNYLG